MGIQYIPGAEQLLAPAAMQITQGVLKFLNPNKDLQQAMTRAMAQNPELVQHMADMEASAPGTYERLGLGADIAGTLRQVPMSAAATTEQALRPGAAGTAKSQQGAARATADATSKTAGPTADLTNAKTALNADVVKGAAKIMAADPSITFDAALKTLTGETGAERASAERKGKLETAVVDKNLEALQRAGKLPKNLEEVNWRDKANEFMNGNLSGAEATAYFGNQDTREAFSAALDAVKLDKQLAAQKALTALRGDPTLGNFRTQKAFQEYQKSGGVGTLDQWESFLFTPEGQARAKGLTNGTIKPTTQQDQDLLSVAKVTRQQIDTDKLSQVTLINDKIAKQLTQVDNAPSDQAREVMLQGLNQLLSERASLGGMKVSAAYNDRGMLLPGRVEYKDEKGKLLDDATVHAVLADPMGSDITQKGPPLTPQAKNALTMITNFAGDKQAALAQLKVQDKSPNREVSKAVEAELIRAGVIKGSTRLGAGPVKE